MKIGQGHAAIVTGAGSGIGRALALALAQKGASLSLFDLSEAGGEQTLQLVREEHRKYQLSNAAIFHKCDVSNPGQLASCFELHMSTFGRLDICINNAGISEKEFFTEDKTSDGQGSWRRVVDVNLVSVIDGTRLAINIMEKSGRGGAILNLASASGLYPAYFMPIYASTKSGVVMFSRSLSKLKQKGIRVNALCPEFVHTEMTKPLDQSMIESTDGYVPIEKVVAGAFELLEDDTKAGHCLWISNRHGSQYWPSLEEKKKYLVAFAPNRASSMPATKTATISAPTVPVEYQKMIVHTLSTNFRSATAIVSVPFKPPVKPGHVLIKHLYAGINASDVNFSAGLYFGSQKSAAALLPFDAGFESVGIVAGLGSGVTMPGVMLGSAVAVMNWGGFSEFGQVAAKYVMPVPAATPAVVALLTSGLTASIALQEAGRIKSGETVLVTAAAGGTGQFAVQLAKLAGNKVLATCGGSTKSELLQKLGVDRVIDYQKEDIKAVLKSEFPKGVDLIYESVGGKMFDTCLNALAVSGRLIIIGMMSQYQRENGGELPNYPGICEKLLWKSQTLVGFYLNNHVKLWRDHLQKLYELYSAKVLKVSIDPTPFTGLESVTDAVEYLHSGRSAGKVVVRISRDAPPVQQSRL